MVFLTNDVDIEGEIPPADRIAVAGTRVVADSSTMSADLHVLGSTPSSQESVT